MCAQDSVKSWEMLMANTTEVTQLLGSVNGGHKCIRCHRARKLSSDESTHDNPLRRQPGLETN